MLAAKPIQRKVPLTADREEASRNLRADCGPWRESVGEMKELQPSSRIQNASLGPGRAHCAIWNATSQQDFLGGFVAYFRRVAFALTLLAPALVAADEVVPEGSGQIEPSEPAPVEGSGQPEPTEPAAAEGSGAEATPLAAPEVAPAPAAEIAPVVNAATATLASAATGATISTADVAAAEKLLPIDITVSVGVRSSLGTIFRPEYISSGVVTNTYSLSASYSVNDEIGVSLDAGMTTYLSKYSGGCYGSQLRTVCFSSPSLGLSYSGFELGDSGASVSFSGGASAGLTPDDLFQHRYGDLSVGSDLSWSYSDLSVSYSLGYAKNFYRDASLIVDNPDDIGGDVYQPSPESREQSLVSTITDTTKNYKTAETAVFLDSGIFASYSVSNDFSLRYKWGKSGVSTGMSFGIADSYAYDVASLTDKSVRNSPYSIAGTRQGQSMSGGFNASYRINEVFGLSASMTTRNATTTRDHKSTPFPFFDLESGNLRYTSVGLSVRASY